MGLFFTGKGDRGTSDLGYGKNIDKTSAEIEAVGQLDELNSLIGLIRSTIAAEDIKVALERVQNDLFTLQAHVADRMYDMKLKAPPFADERIEWLESTINTCEARVQPEKGFVVSGEHKEAAWLDYARAVSRRAERALLVLHKEKSLTPALLAYTNRLSSLFFALARLSAKKSRVKEKHPLYR